MGKFGVSATDIGLRLLASGEEVNRLLKEQGFLEGAPGAYGLTSKGEKFGAERSHDNGYGGVAARNWSTTHYDPSIIDALDSSPEDVQRVRAEISAEKKAKREARKIEQDEAAAKFYEDRAEKDSAEAEQEIDLQKVLLVTAGLAGAVGASVGIYKGIERYKRKKVEKSAAVETEGDWDAGSAS